MVQNSKGYRVAASMRERRAVWTGSLLRLDRDGKAYMVETNGVA